MEENRLYEQHEEGFSLCLRVREKLPDFLEGCLDTMTAEAIRAHLSVCYLCARLFGEMEHTIKLIDTMPMVDLDQDHAPSIMAAIQQQTGQDRKPWWRRLPPNPLKPPGRRE